MAYFKSLAIKAGRACHDFSMINEGDKILICFSGGKDSFLLLKVLVYLKRRYPINFDLKVLAIDPGFDLGFSSKIKDFFEKDDLSEDVEYEVLSTEIKNVVEEQGKIKKFRPCFMCSRLRRGIIYDYAMKNDYNKIALGHNLDDAIETHLMNFFYSSKTSFMKPKYLAENGKIEVIRPLIYLDEDDIVSYTEKVGFVAVKNECPLRDAGESNREYFKKFLGELKERNPKVKENAYHAFFNDAEFEPWQRRSENK